LVNELSLVKRKANWINYLKRKHGMPRPNKILEPTKTYNLLLKEKQYDKLAYAAHQMQKTAREQVAVADLIREAIDIYIEAWENDDVTEDEEA
jgi:hypothetical protein